MSDDQNKRIADAIAAEPFEPRELYPLSPKPPQKRDGTILKWMLMTATMSCGQKLRRGDFLR